MRANVCLSSAWILCLSWTSLETQAAGGIGGTTPSEMCSQTLEELQNLLVNQDQDENGVEGGTLVTNDCKDLVDADVMDIRDDEDQKSLCGNSCYDTINAIYKTLLDNDCFASDDADQEASAKLQAASYQIACQTNSDGKYCSTLVKDAGTSFSLCNDIVSELGCCFQSYRQYMLLGTAASVVAMDDAQKECTDKGIGGLDAMCPCSCNQHAFTNTTFCSHAIRRYEQGVAQAIFMAITTLFLFFRIFTG